jgi:flagellar protein FlaF
MIPDAYDAYRQVVVGTENPKMIERQVFAQATSLLRSFVSEEGDEIVIEGSDQVRRRVPPALAEAIHRNRSLWTTIALDLIEDDNRLPNSLKTSLLSLYKFVDSHSNKILKGEATVNVLIDINISIMKGLAIQEQAAA